STRPPPPAPTPFPSTTLFRSREAAAPTPREREPAAPPAPPALRVARAGPRVPRHGPARRASLHRSPLSRLRAPVGHRVPRQLVRSEEHTSELQSRENLVCRLL